MKSGARARREWGDTVEGVALAIRKVGAVGRQLATSALKIFSLRYSCCVRSPLFKIEKFIVQFRHLPML